MGPVRFLLHPGRTVNDLRDGLGLRPGVAGVGQGHAVVALRGTEEVDQGLPGNRPSLTAFANQDRFPGLAAVAGEVASYDARIRRPQVPQTNRPASRAAYAPGPPRNAPG